MDVPLPLMVSGNKYLLVVVDCFTKWVEAFPLKNIRARTIVETFLNQVVSRQLEFLWKFTWIKEEILNHEVFVSYHEHLE